jgi:predicted nucleic acid-binding protein
VKIYLDLCAIQRPLDTSSQVRIALEAEAVLGIIKFFEGEQVELVSSEALVYEGEQSALPIRKEHTRAVLAKAKSIVQLTEKEQLRAANLLTFGIKPLDALHLALAELAKADYFCTCDDKLLQTSMRVPDLMVKVVDPVDPVQEIEK